MLDGIHFRSGTLVRVARLISIALPGADNYGMVPRPIGKTGLVGSVIGRL